MEMNKECKKDIEKDSIDNRWYVLLRESLAEFAGTLMLMLIGCSAGAALTLNPQNKSNLTTDIWAVNICWGFGAFVGITTSLNISGGHINPAVSIALATIGKFKWKKVLPYVIAQMLGAILGAGLAYVCYFDAIKLQNENILIYNNTRLQAYGHDLSTGKMFATYPASHVTLLGSIVDQVIGTASLLFAVTAIGDERNLKIPKVLQPLILAFVIAVHAIAFGFNEGAPLNPARDLGPRLFTYLAGYGSDVFTAINGNYWWSGGIVGPTVGAICGVWSYYFLIEYHHPKDTFDDNIDNNKIETITYDTSNQINISNHKFHVKRVKSLV